MFQLRDLRTLDPYRTYLSKQDESQKMFADVVRKYSNFSSFIEVSLFPRDDSQIGLMIEDKIFDDRYWEHRTPRIVNGAGPAYPPVYSAVFKWVQFLFLGL